MNKLDQHAPIYVSVTVPKPKDEKAWEKAMTAVARWRFQDPKARRYGRTGQKQHGFDIRGGIGRDPTRVFVIQCKQTDKPNLPRGTLTNEFAAAKKKHGDLAEFVLATTASRDVAVQDDQLRLQQELAQNGEATEIDVWFWDDIEEFCETEPALRRIFDPTFSTQQDAIAATQEVMRDEQQAQSAQLTEIQRLTVEIHTEMTGESNSLTDEGRRDTGNHGRITAAIDLINDGEVSAAQTQLNRIEELDLVVEERFRLIEAKAALLYRIGDGEAAAEALEAIFDLDAYEDRKPYKRALQATFRQNWADAARLSKMAIDGGATEVEPIRLLVQARANIPTQTDPTDGIDDAHLSDLSVRFARTFWLRRTDDAAWLDEAERLLTDFPEDEHARIIAAEAVIQQGASDGGYYAAGASSAEKLAEASSALADVAEARFDRGVFVDWSTVINAVTSLRVAGDVERCRALLDRALSIRAEDPSLRLQRALLEVDHGDPATLLDFIAPDETDPPLAFFRMQVLLHKRRFEELDAALASAIESGLHADHEPLFHAVRSRFRHEREGVARALASLEEDPPLEAVIRHTLRGEIFLKDGDRKSAKAEVDAAVGASNTSTGLPALVDLGALALGAGGTRSVTAALDGRLNLSHPEPAALWLRLCAAGEERRRFADAISSMPDLVLNDPAVLIARFEMALSAGDPNFVSLATEVEKAEPRSLAVLANLLMVLDSSGERRRVEGRLKALDFDDYEWSLEPALVLARRAFHHEMHGRTLDLAYEALCRSWDSVAALDTYQALFFAATKADPDLVPTEVTRFDATSAIVLRDGSGQEHSYIHPSTDLHPVLTDKLPLSGDDLARFEDAKVGDRLSIASGPEAELFEVVAIKPIFVDVLHRSMARSKREFGERAGNKSITFNNGDVRPFLELVRTQERQKQTRLNDALATYNEQPFPVSTFAQFLGIDTVFAFHTLLQNGGSFFAADGFAHSLDRATKLMADPPPAVVVDPLTVYFIVRGGHLKAVKSVISRLLITQSVLDMFESRLADMSLSGDPDGFSLVLHEGEILRRDNDPKATGEERARRKNEIEIIRASFEIVPAVPCNDLLTSSHAHPEVIGRAEWDSILAASGEGVPLMSDDLRLRDIARGVAEIEGLWLHPVMKRANSIGSISDRELSDYVAGIVLAKFDTVSFSGKDMLEQVFAASDCPVTEEVEGLLRTASGPFADLANNIAVTAGVVDELREHSTSELSAMQLLSAALYAFSSPRWGMVNEICEAFVAALGQSGSLADHISSWRRWHQVGVKEQ